MTEGFMLWVAIALLGIWSSAGLLIRLQKANARRLDELIDLLRQDKRS